MGSSLEAAVNNAIGGRGDRVEAANGNSHDQNRSRSGLSVGDFPVSPSRRRTSAWSPSAAWELGRALGFTPVSCLAKAHPTIPPTKGSQLRFLIDSTILLDFWARKPRACLPGAARLEVLTTPNGGVKVTSHQFSREQARAKPDGPQRYSACYWMPLPVLGHSTTSVTSPPPH